MGIWQPSHPRIRMPHCSADRYSSTGPRPYVFISRYVHLRSSAFIWVWFSPFIRAIRAICLIRDPSFDVLTHSVNFCYIYFAK